MLSCVMVVAATMMPLGQAGKPKLDPLTYDRLSDLTGTWQGSWIRAGQHRTLDKVIVERRGKMYVVFWQLAGERLTDSNSNMPAAHAFRVFESGWEYHMLWGYVSFDEEETNRVRSRSDTFRGGPAVDLPGFPTNFDARLDIQFGDEEVTVHATDVQAGQHRPGAPQVLKRSADIEIRLSRKTTE